MKVQALLKSMPKEVWLVHATTLINRMGMMVLTYLSIYLTLELGFGEKSAAFIVGVYGLGAFVGAPVAGYLCDRWNAPGVMKLSLFLQGLILLAYPFAGSFYSFLVITLVWAFVGEAFKPASQAYITGLTDEKQRRLSFALNRTAINIGMTVGPSLGGILAVAGASLVFYGNSVASILAGVFLTASFWLVGARGRAGAYDGPRADWRSALGDRRLMFLLLALLPTFVVFFQYRTTMSVYLVNNHGMEKKLFLFLISINTMLVILLEAPLNWFLQRWPEKLSMSAGALLIGAGYGGFALTSSFPGAVACCVVWTLGEMALFASSSTYVSKLSGEQKKGRYMGLYNMGLNFAAFVGPWLGTASLAHSERMTWVMTFVLGFVSAALLLLARWPDEADSLPLPPQVEAEAAASA